MVFSDGGFRCSCRFRERDELWIYRYVYLSITIKSYHKRNLQNGRNNQKEIKQSIIHGRK